MSAGPELPGNLGKWIKMLNLPDNWLVLLVVILSGGGNVLTTQQGDTAIMKTAAREEELNKVFSEIHEIHSSIDGFEKRQKEIVSHLEANPTPHQ